MSEVQSVPTLEDVAKISGVSAKTVSNVVRSKPGVSAATRERVQEAIAQIGYQANAAGRSLASRRTGRVAVVVPMLYQPYFAEMAERLIMALDAHDLISTIRIAPDAAAERDAVCGISTADADAVIICPHAFTQEMVGDRLPARPVVQLGGQPLPAFDTVVMGEFQGFHSVTQHLFDRGRNKIALVWNAFEGEFPRGERWDGFAQAHAERGLEVDPAMVTSGSDWDRRASGYEATVSLLRSGVEFDALQCVNDAVAVGALRALQAHGRRVPVDVALAGFDATAETAFTTPTLTSVSPRPAQMASAAVQMLTERLGGHTGPGRHVRIGADLLIRESTGSS